MSGKSRIGKCRSDNGWKVVQKEKKSVRYQRLEQSIWFDNYCKDTKAIPEQAYILPHIKAVFRSTRDQRVSSLQTRFNLCSLYYLAACQSHMPHLAIYHYAKQRPQILYSIINCNKIQTLFSQMSENIFHEVT